MVTQETTNFTITKAEAERFWSKVAITANKEKCWEWTGGKRRRGYGQFYLKGKNVVATRLSYMINTGTSLNELCVLHTCDNPSCVNPSHLLAGSAKDNSIDMMKKCRGENQFSNGTSHPISKLKDEDVINIRLRLSNGEYQKSIGNDYNVHQSLISRIKSRELWNHL